MASSSSSSASALEGYPMDNEWLYVHGRIDPGLEENLERVESIDTNALRHPPRMGQLQSLLSGVEGHAVIEGGESHLQEASWTRTSKMIEAGHLATLPAELLDLILSFLGPVDLSNISLTCRILCERSSSDLVWARHVQDNVPGVKLEDATPFGSYRDLYIAHDPHWFLPKYKLWFNDYYLTGKLILARYNPRHGSIEGYRLVAERPPPIFETWEADPEVIIHSFEPLCSLHLDQPTLKFDAPRRPQLDSDIAGPWSLKKRHWARFDDEIAMPNDGIRGTVHSNFLFTRAVEPYPSMQLWPPLTIPASERVRNSTQESFIGSNHRPQHRSEICTQAFRVRRWLELNSEPGRRGYGLSKMGEEVHTYSTLDPKLYTPTEDKPYRGIWVGDYSGHGCEFLLMHQPDDAEPFDEASVVQREDETVAEWETRKKEERICRGSLEAIKLTGDPNVPRGEHTFISDDISNDSLVRVAEEERFRGARIVRSRGHIAARMFRNDKYIESQLIMISPNRLAQYWVGFGHISFYQRVNIDQFLDPEQDPRSVRNGSYLHPSII